MELWGWLAAYVVGFLLIQLLVFRYVRGGASLDDAGPEATSTSQLSAVEHATPAGDDDSEGDGRYCAHCGTRNASDATFTYCRECLQPL